MRFSLVTVYRATMAMCSNFRLNKTFIQALYCTGIVIVNFWFQLF